MLKGRTELHIFDRGSVIGDRYCEEVLLPHVRLFQGAIGPDFIFMDNNARPHRTLAVEGLLESEDITRMDWPAYSPDLNPIERVWYALGRRIAARLHHPENTQQLKQMLIEEWALLPQEMLHQLVLSMRRRCEATIAITHIFQAHKDKNGTLRGFSGTDFPLLQMLSKHLPFRTGVRTDISFNHTKSGASFSKGDKGTTRGLLATDHVILNHGQVTWATPELAAPLLTTTPHQREDVSAPDRFNVHLCPTRWIFSGTELELMP
ncbi:transposable element Tcb2 transposase [Trichonephila clavipes]|nr:transposable element Tcb2 transposase [Trichonephila clavipes]